MKAGKVNSPYKKVGPCGKPYPGDFHLQDENHSHPQLLHQPHQLQYKPANKKNHTAVFLAVAVLTLVIAVVSITVQVILFKEYNDLKAEVELQMQMLETMKRQEDVTPQTVQEVIETNLEIIEQLDGHEHEGNDVLRRKKRSDDPRRNRNSNRRQNRPRESAPAESEIGVVHMVINQQHEHAVSRHLKTGPRGSVIQFWKYSDDIFNDQQTFADLNVTTGRIRIKKTGLYFVYSQMTYFDRSGRWSHIVMIDETPFVKCLASEWGIEEDPDTGALYNTIHQCHTAAVTHIRREQEVTIRSMYPERVIHADKEMTFVGIVKLT